MPRLTQRNNPYPLTQPTWPLASLAAGKVEENPSVGNFQDGGGVPAQANQGRRRRRRSRRQASYEDRVQQRHGGHGRQVHPRAGGRQRDRAQVHRQLRLGQEDPPLRRRRGGRGYPPAHLSGPGLRRPPRRYSVHCPLRAEADCDGEFRRRDRHMEPRERKRQILPQAERLRGGSSAEQGPENDDLAWRGE